MQKRVRRAIVRGLVADAEAALRRAAG